MIWDCIGFIQLYSMIGPENWHHSLNQPNVKPTVTWTFIN